VTGSGSDTFASVKRPFIGLRPFQYGDRDFFFGRGEELDDLEPMVAHNRFVAIVGSSGSGKSSLIRSGLWPRLTAAEGEHWLWVDLHPGDAPIYELAHALAGLEERSPELAEAWADRLELLLRRSSFGIAEGVALFRTAKGKRLLLLIDQFEELFRFADLRAERNHDSTTAAEHRDEATAFVRLLLTAANSHQSPIHIVLTMRSDFIGDCSRFHGLPEAVTRSQFLVPGLTRDERAAAICGPVERAAGQIDPGLVQRALNDTNEDPDQLPILQHAMMRCWEYAVQRAQLEGSGTPKLTMDDYEKIGGVAKALSLHANEILRDLAHSSPDTANVIASEMVTKRLFQALTDTDRDGRVVRRPQRFGDLVKYIVPEAEKATPHAYEDAVRRVVNRFASSDCSFLRAPTAGELQNDSIIDIGHEALIRRWDMLKGDGDTDWIREEQDDAEQYRDLVRASRGDGFLSETELQGYGGWWSRRQPNRFWARRYTKGNTDQFDSVVELLERSRGRVAAARRTRKVTWATGLATVTALILALLYGYYSHLQGARLSAEARAEALAARAQLEQAALNQNQDFRARMIAVVADATLSQRIITGPADALTLALAKPENLPDAGEYVRVLYRGLGELRERRRIVGLQSQVFGVSFNPRQHVLSAVTAGSPSLINFWQDDGVFLDSVKAAESGFVMNARWSPDGQRIYVGTSPAAHIITPCSHELLRKYFESCRGATSDLSLQIGTAVHPAGYGAWSPDGKWILTGGFQSPARLWDAFTGDPVQSFAAAVDDYKDQSAPSVAISSDLKHIAVGLVSGEILILNPEAMTIEKKLKLPSTNPGGIPFSLAFDPKDSNVLLAAYQNPTAQLWDVDKGTARPLAQEAGNVLQVAFDPNGRFMVTAANDGVVRLWMMPEVGAELTSLDLRGHLGPVFAVDVNAEGLIASGGGDKMVRLWGGDAPLSAKRVSNDAFGTLNRHDFAIDGQDVIVAKNTGVEFRAEVPTDFKPVDAVMSFDGRGIVVAPRHGHPLLFLRDYPDFPVATLTGPSADWMSVSFVAGQTRIAAKASDGSVYLWPFISDVGALERLAEDNLPFRGSKRITLPAVIRCRFILESAKNCDALVE
jgi:WD40 repeat protein